MPAWLRPTYDEAWIILAIITCVLGLYTVLFIATGAWQASRSIRCWKMPGSSLDGRG